MERKKLEFLRFKYDLYLLIKLFDECEGIETEKDNYVLEFEAFKKQIETEIQNYIKSETEIVFKNVNKNDFNFLELENVLQKIGTLYGNKRNKDEIYRDELLDISYTDLTSQYKESSEYRELLSIHNDRLNLKVKTILFLKENYKTYYLNIFKNNGILKLEINNNILEFFQNEAVKAINGRDLFTIKRDDYAYIKIEDYIKAINDGFLEAKFEIQKFRRDEVSDLLKKYIEHKKYIQKNNFILYDIESNLNHYVSDLFKNRNAEIIYLENNLLISHETYNEWCNLVLNQIKKGYFIKENVDIEIHDNTQNYDDFVFDENNNHYVNNNSEYDKYNGYNGFDDETIDNAFEGDPENTWNID